MMIMPNFDDLPNVGPYLKEKLLDAGIESPQELIRLGSRSAFLILKARDPGVCLHVLYALEGAVRGIRKQHLPDEEKQALKNFFNALKGL